MEIDKTKLRNAMKQIRQILLDKWDPIGIMKMEGWPQDEYDSYIGPIFNRLHVGTTAEELAALLNQFETENMGLRPRNKEDLIQIGSLLLEIRVDVGK